jgi:hypothetical protein
MDGYGGTLEHRMRALGEALDGIRAATDDDFQGVGDQTLQARYTAQPAGNGEPTPAARMGSSTWPGSRSRWASTGSGERCDVLVNDQVLQFWIGAELMKTVARTSTGEVRKKNAPGTGRGH